MNPGTEVWMGGRLVRAPKIIQAPNSLLTCRLALEVPRGFPGKSPNDVFEVWVENGKLANDCTKHLKVGTYIGVRGTMHILQPHEEQAYESTELALRIVAWEVKRLRPEQFEPQLMPEGMEGYVPVP